LISHLTVLQAYEEYYKSWLGSAKKADSLQRQPLKILNVLYYQLY
jgi:hypothetical protein